LLFNFGLEYDIRKVQEIQVELKTAITSGKKRTTLQDPQVDPRARIRDASKWDVQRVSENEEMALVERSASSETKNKEIIHGVGVGHVRAAATPVVTGLTVVCVREREMKKT
jgi:hypothetical protein